MLVEVAAAHCSDCNHDLETGPAATGGAPDPAAKRETNYGADRRQGCGRAPPTTVGILAAGAAAAAALL